MTITILLIATNLKVGKEALNGFIEIHSMFSEFVPLEVILEIRRSKPMPIDHGSFYRGATRSGIRRRPNGQAFTRADASVFCEPREPVWGAAPERAAGARC